MCFLISLLAKFPTVLCASKIMTFVISYLHIYHKAILFSELLNACCKPTSWCRCQTIIDLILLKLITPPLDIKRRNEN